MYYFIFYILGVLSFCLWDACIGFGYDFDGYHTPPLPIVAVFWFISIPILLLCGFVRLCIYLKEARIKRQNKKETQ